jgi:hypothetical protein
VAIWEEEEFGAGGAQWQQNSGFHLPMMATVFLSLPMVLYTVDM